METLEVQREVFAREKENWLEEQAKWETEHRTWEEENTRYNEGTETMEEKEGDHEMRLKLAEMAREVGYDERRLAVLYLQVAEQDQRWLLEATYIESVWKLKGEMAGQHTTLHHTTKLKTAKLQAAVLDKTKEIVATLERQSRDCVMKMDALLHEEIRLEAGPSRKPDTKEAERARWALQRKKLKSKLKQKLEKRDAPMTLTVLPYTVGHTPTCFPLNKLLPGIQVEIVREGLPDVPVTLITRGPIEVMGATTVPLVDGKAIFTDITVKLRDPPAPHLRVFTGTLLCGYPQCGTQSAFTTALDIPLENMGKANPWETNPPKLTQLAITAVSTLDDPISLTKEMAERIVTASVWAEGNVLHGALGDQQGVRLATCVGGWDIYMTLLTGSVVHQVVWTPVHVVALTEGRTFVWERDFVKTWVEYTTSLPSTTARYAFEGMRCGAWCGDGKLVFINKEGVTKYWCDGKVIGGGESVSDVACVGPDVFYGVEDKVVHEGRGAVWSTGSTLRHIDAMGSMVEDEGWLFAASSDTKLFVSNTQGTFATQDSLITAIKLTSGGTVLLASSLTGVTLWDVALRHKIHTFAECSFTTPLEAGISMDPPTISLSLHLVMGPVLSVWSVEATGSAGKSAATDDITSWVVSTGRPVGRAVENASMSPRRPSPSTCQGYLGIKLKDTENGPMCLGLAMDGPAMEAGLKEGDVVIGFGKTQINSSGEFREAARAVVEGERIRVCYIRENKVEECYVDVGQPAPACDHASEVLSADACTNASMVPPRRKFSSKKPVYKEAPPLSPSWRSASAASSSTSVFSTSLFTPEEQRNLSTENFNNTTPLARLHGFLKANNAPIPTPTNEATLRRSVAKLLTKCRKRGTPYVNWWNVTRPPKNVLQR